VAKALTKQTLDIICFTGSTETGRLVAIEAAKNLTPCILELGGKCPVIVDETANLHSAAIRIIFGKYINSGQTCVAADHIYINQKVYK
jgi:aldehyde dehydrogenase (NAD+)